MPAEESSRERASRLVRENAARIERRRGSISQMTALRQTHLLAEAHRLLALMEQNQVWFLHRLQALSTHEGGHQRPELDT
ncbi:hypothetical protein [Muricoccus pecuniae]|uniref:Uncharacterized protein n=1 Tax=Muricoccus pecuniae TaxID=693023 RepID=A0A840YAB6_9PROT|nr:hypothetical protein [Roseomonas pecuniae]MBB5695649.1 hypothetical protein [Roseomonas pecuniae]